MSQDLHAADILAIQGNLSLFGRALDLQDWEAVASTFVEGATIDYDSMQTFQNGVPDFLARLQEVFSQLAYTQHLIGSMYVTLDGDRGHCASSVQATHVGHAGQYFTTGGRYEDDVVRTEGGWKMSVRRFRRQFGFDPSGFGTSLGVSNLSVGA